MKILLCTDAWAPQINGVVRTWEKVITTATKMGHEVRVIHPGLFNTVPCPTYPEVKLAIAPNGRIRDDINEWSPGAIHIATEGPIGLAARHICLTRHLPFTTSYHTKFPEYASERVPIPVTSGHKIMQWFHSPATAVLVATQTIRDELAGRGHTNMVAWTRGVDLTQFKADLKPAVDLPGPVFVYVGRIAVEKNVEGFLNLDLPGSKLVVGDGPAREALEAKYPDAQFAGVQKGEALARHYAAGDVFVFPSRTDTFGLVMLEAMACGLPVAANPVPGPLDVIGDSPAGVLDEDLKAACLGALDIAPETAIAHAGTFTWQACTEIWLETLAALPQGLNKSAHGRSIGARLLDGALVSAVLNYVKPRSGDRLMDYATRLKRGARVFGS